jgi:hypothetical protein
MKTTICSNCGGGVIDGKQKYHHLRRCVGYKLEGVDHLRCCECGYRSPMLTQHIKIHEMSVEEYRSKFPLAPVQLESAIEKRNRSNIGTHVIPIQDRSGAILCSKCGEWYLQRFAAKHLSDCVSSHPDKYEKGKDYVECPECSKALLRLGEHLKDFHGWDSDRLALEVGKGLKLTAESVADKWRETQDFAMAQKRREQTHLERHGFSNPFSDPAVRAKIIETSQRRYGADHPMQNEEVLIRQTESAQRGPSGQEVFFDEHTCENVVYCGNGIRFIRTKVGVRKCGRVIKDLNPDFIVLPDNVLESAMAASKDGKRLDRQKHRSRYVIELLGDWYHSKEVIGVDPVEHEREIVEAYKSAGIECLVLWEKDVMNRWESIRPMVDAWINKAVADMNEYPIFSRATKSQVDRRVGAFVCPYGSERRFRTQEKLTKWMLDPLNFWHPAMIEGRDYVRCLECQNVRVGKIAEHLRQSHSGMTKEDYLAKNPGALMKADRVGNGR